MIGTSTGLPALDDLIGTLDAGDNLVWRVDRTEDYARFAQILSDSLQNVPEREVVYFRFADHEPVITGARVVAVPLDRGFESFITRIHAEIEAIGNRGVFFFDSLSELSTACYSDRMIGNFFQLTCPLVYRLGAVAYFGLRRYVHSYHTVVPITNTTQVLIDVYRHGEEYYIRPVKTAGRHDESTFTLYHCEKESLQPISESVRISEIIHTSEWPGLPSTSYRMVGVWDRVFLDAEHVQQQIDEGKLDPSEAIPVVDKLLSLIISRDERVATLARDFFSLKDIIAIWKRMIGTGLIGGKSIGMLLAQAILRNKGGKWPSILENHDSFFIGSDVYYTYLVVNDVWTERQQQKDPDRFLEPEASGKILTGGFPDYIIDRFADMLDYFGRAPIIVRSSSLMEDNFGNAFAGKYDSVFCTNQGSREQRLEELLSAVRHVYASSVSDDALKYRNSRGLLDQDEQMALLVQRVSGAPHGRYFFPQLAGVAFSYNPYSWHHDIDPAAGMLRLVFGLGTRAVDRADDDYTRVVALNAPDKRPESGFDEVKRHSQRRVDVLDLEKHTLRNVHFVDILKTGPTLPLQLVGTRDRDLARNRSVDANLTWVLTFERLLRDTDYVTTMRELIATLKEAYGTEVDIEFTTNFLDENTYRINVVQCRPLQVQGVHLRPTPLPQLRDDQIILRAKGGVVGHSRVTRVDRLIYIHPHAYSRLGEQDRYRLADAIGEVTRACATNGNLQMLVGPGRWGTSTPALGIPVSFSHISPAGVLCEIDTIHEGLIADLSLGTHFFNELVEMNLLYVAFFSGQTENVLRLDYIQRQPNLLSRLVPALSEWEETISVVAPADGTQLMLNADSRNQLAVLYEEPE